MKIVVIGGTGHIGTYLIPRLVQEGHAVVSLSRGARKPYRDPGIWKFVEQHRIDRAQEEGAGSFGARIAAMAPDVVVDLICFTLESARHLVEKLEGKVGQFLFCGTIWVHGHSEVVPATEAGPRRPFGDYGVRKAAIEAWLLEMSHRAGFPATILHPGHIVGPGWVPLNPAGNFNPDVFKSLAEGKKLLLPNLGHETVHHVHADDVAQAFYRAMQYRSTAIGESFHVVSPAAMTLRGFAERMSRWFGHEADLSYLPWDEWRKTVAPKDAEATWDHLAHSPNCSMEKAARLIHYTPRYTSMEGVCESVDWLVEHGWQA
jgi:nucleoside-diphosphate-sugar epimerase